MKYDVTCPHCSKMLSLSEENFDNICICPHCHEEIDFAKDDVASEETSREEENKRFQKENKVLLNMQSRIKSRFKFVIARFDEVEGLINLLYRQEGWYVISQSTVFISETETPGFFSNSNTREEGLALIFRKDD